MKALRLLTVICGAALVVAIQAGAARAELKKQWVDYKEGNTPLYGYLVYDDAITGKRPGVLLAHSRAGMSEATLRDSDMIAKMGLFSGTQHAFTNPQNAAEERADREYKVATPRFLKEVFGQP